MSPLTLLELTFPLIILIILLTLHKSDAGKGVNLHIFKMAANETNNVLLTVYGLKFLANCRSKPYSKAWCIGLFLHCDRQQYLQPTVTLSQLLSLTDISDIRQKNKNEAEVVIYYNP